MVKIGAACTFYNDKKGLERLLPTLKQFDEIILNDGAWRDYESGGLSTDGSRELIPELPKYHLINNPNLMLAEKQNKHLKLAGELNINILVLIDSDEYLTEFDRNKFENSMLNVAKRKQNVYWCKFLEYHTDWVAFHYPRIILNPSECEYRERHNQIFSHDTPQIHTKRGLIIQGITIKHDKSIRTDMRENYNKSWNLEHPRH